MFRVDSFQATFRMFLIASLVLAASGAVAQDKSQAQAPTDAATKDSAASAQDKPQDRPQDAVDPLKRPTDEKLKKKNAKALKIELSKPYKKWLDEDVIYIITD